MKKDALIINFFSSNYGEKKCAAWELALDLSRKGLSVECLTGKGSDSVMYGMSEDLLSGSLVEQGKKLDDLKSIADVVINCDPLLNWKLYHKEPGVEYLNQIEDAVLGYHNFNVYLKTNENIADLKMKILVLPDEVYGEYERCQVGVLANNVMKTYERITERKEVQLSSTARGYQNYTNLKKIISRYENECDSIDGVVSKICDQGFAKIEKSQDGIYKIRYKNIRVAYKSHGNLGVGMLSKHYSVFQDGESEKGGKRYDYQQQADYRRQLRNKSLTPTNSL